MRPASPPVFESVRPEMLLIRYETADILVQLLKLAGLCASEASSTAQSFLFELQNRRYEAAAAKGAELILDNTLPAAEHLIVALPLAVLNGRYSNAEFAIFDYLADGFTLGVYTDQCLSWIDHCRQTERICSEAEYEDPFQRLPSAGPFIIIMEKRTGSSLVVSWLNSHPRVICYPEMLVGWDVLTQERIAHLVARGGCPERLSPYAQSPKYQPISAFQKSALEASGFKTTLKDLQEPLEFGRLLRAHNFKIVFMGRTNSLRQAISFSYSENLFQTRGLHNIRAGIDPKAEPFDVNPTVIIQLATEFAESRRVALSYVSSLNLPFIIVDYSEIMHNPENVAKKILAFIGAAPAKLHGTFDRILARQLMLTIRNYEELSNTLRGTPWQTMLEAE